MPNTPMLLIAMKSAGHCINAIIPGAQYLIISKVLNVCSWPKLLIRVSGIFN
jgi:hypothetical protein